ncbi:hypothetical protein EJB05_34829, partial [Eragrostis curvula]
MKFIWMNLCAGLSEHGNEECTNEKFRKFANSLEQQKILNEYWNIVNKTFASEEEAYSFYNKYAFVKGFGIRRQNVRRAKYSRELLFRRFVCYKQGEREDKYLETEDCSRRPRAQTRCHCPAELAIRLDRSRGVWFVSNFVDEHNHCPAGPGEVPFLYGGYDRTPFQRKDIYNFSSKYKRKRIEHGDANTVLRFMLNRQKIDPDFYFDYLLDAKGRLKHMFWCDTQSRMDYQSFGDVVVFDSTYRMNRYKMPFVPFVGLNHHRCTTVFGCGIVSNERVESFVWLLGAFMRAMCQQKPKSIITDGDNAMMNAIRQVLPGVYHRICSWHLEKNIPKHLYYKSLDAFRKLMYSGTSASAFRKRWKAFVANHQTAKNKGWLKMMYNSRKLWANALQYENYFLGMRSNQRSESLNSCLHRHLDIYMSLLDLVLHYDNSVSRLRETEAADDCTASTSFPVALTDYKEIEESASHIFTAANFYKIQEDLSKIDEFQISETLVGANMHRFIITRKVNQKVLFIVDYMSAKPDTTINCSCRKMEREGLPCTHIFHVLHHLNISEIPKCCILKRHSKDAKGGLPSKRKSSMYVWSTKRSRYSDLTVLGAEAFDAVAHNHEDFCSIKDFLGAVISKKRKLNNSCSSGGESSVDVDGKNQSGSATIGVVHDPTVVATKGAPRKSVKGPSVVKNDGSSTERWMSSALQAEFIVSGENS